MNTTQIIHRVESVTVEHHINSIKLTFEDGNGEMFSTHIFVSSPDSLAELQKQLPATLDTAIDDEEGRLLALMDGASHSDYVIVADVKPERDANGTGDRDYVQYDVTLLEVTLHGEDVMHLLGNIDVEKLEEIAAHRWAEG